MSLTKTQFDRVKSTNGNVIVEVKMFDDFYIMGNGEKLIINTKYEPQDHITVRGIVHKLPEKLNFNPDKPASSMGWETDIEIKEGDLVYMDYLTVLLAFGKYANIASEVHDPKFFSYDDRYFVIIPYSQIFFKVVNEEITMLNGYVLGEKIKQPPVKSPIIILDGYATKHRLSNKSIKVRVISSGSLVKRYIEKKITDTTPLKSGDVVHVRENGIMYGEKKMHQTILKDKDLIIFQRRFVLAKES